MRQFFLAIALVGALSLAVAEAMAGGPPVVNQADHLIGASLEPEVGINCGTGQATLITGTFGGVIHTLVKADGTVHVNGAVRGSAINDDLPVPDGIADASTTFTSSFNDIFRASGGEVHHFTLNGVGTTATGAGFRFHVVIKLLLDQNADPKVDFVRLTCF
ncbi:MAG TPA: hypothetical protein VLD67_22475 [Vicinamibacterales bacterium]|nr:hypothetical protein [Vicinamibacterales bacterium]